MKPGPEADPLYLARILEIIQLIRESLAEVSEGDFLRDRDKADATALRLSAIGEFSRKLSEELRSRQSQIAWLRMYSLRNIVAHNYDNDACRAELNRIDG